MKHKTLLLLMQPLLCLALIPSIHVNAKAYCSSASVEENLYESQNMTGTTPGQTMPGISATDPGWVLAMTGDIAGEPTAAPKKANRQAAPNKTIRLLSIGNSFSQDAQEWIYNVAKAAGYEDIIIANLYWGGCDLRTHASNAKTDFGGDGSHYEYQMHRSPQQIVTRDKSIKGALLDQEWDYVTLQQVSQDAGMVGTFTDGNLDYLISYVKEYRPNAKIGWHMTWAYQQNSDHGGFANYNRDQKTMYNAIVRCTRDIVMKKSGMDFVLPAGTAIQNLRTSFIGDNLTRDGYHMSYYLGRYTVSLTWIYKLCELQGNPYPEDITYVPSESEVPTFYLPAIHEAVKNAVLNPYKVSTSSYPDIKDLLDIDPAKYVQTEWSPKANSYWHSAGNVSQTLGTSDKFVASKLFKREDIPTGSLIEVDEGFQYRPEGWETGTSTTNPRPGVVTMPEVIVTDGWWGTFNYRAFNVSKISEESLNGKVDEAVEHFRIYMPKMLGDGGTFKIVNKESGKPLAVKEDSQADNATLVQDSRNTSVVWTFEYAGNGYYYIVNKNSGKALGVPSNSTKENTLLTQTDKKDARNQQWNVISLGNNLYRISPKCAPTLALNVAGDSQSDGVYVVQAAYQSADRQKFLLQGVTLADKVAATPQGGTLTVDDDYEEAVVIAQDKDITIDLNGHKLTSAGTNVIKNSGKLRIIDSAGNGSIEVAKNSGSNIEAVVNEKTGTLTVEGGTVFALQDGGVGRAVAIHNKGKLENITGGSFKAWSKGKQSAYALWNNGGTANVADGWFYAADLADWQNNTSSMAVYNASGTVNISGGVFIGKTRSEGDGLGLRTGGTANISGGSFLGTNGIGYFRYDNYGDGKNGMKQIAVRTTGSGKVNFLDGTHQTTNLDGPEVVLAANQHYVTFVDEAEMTIATYVLDNNGTIVGKWGHTQESYDVYFGNKTETVTEADLPRYGEDTILYANTGDKREVMYFLGSSVTYGTNDHGNSWADYLADRYGDQVIVRKRALSGTTLVNTEDASYIGRMLTQIPTTARMDHLIVQLSTNDSGWGLPIGKLGPKNEFRSEYYDNRIDDYGKKGNREIINGMEFIIAYAMETWQSKVTYWSGPDCSRDSYSNMESALTKLIYPKWNKKGMGVIDYFKLWHPEKGVVINDDMVHPYQAGYWEMVPYAYDYFLDFNSKVAAADIDAIGDIADEGTVGERIAKARFVYDHTMKDAKDKVENYAKLQAAEKEYDQCFADTRKIDNATEVTPLAGPGGTGNEGYASLFDGKIATKTCSDDFTTKEFIWKFSEPMAVKYYSLTTANDNFQWKGRNPKSWILYGSNDSDDQGNGTWTEVDNVSNDTYLTDENYFTALYKVDSPARFKYYKLKVTDTQARTMQLSEMTMLEDTAADATAVRPQAMNNGSLRRNSTHTYNLKGQEVTTVGSRGVYIRGDKKFQSARK